MQPDGTRVYHDPLHGAIALYNGDPVEHLLIHLIDTPAFQRLRRIRQLGPASLTFHGAEASRFTHSLGVMAIARRAFNSLVHRHPDLEPHRATVLCAALLHDLGHGPFSHTAEEIFAGQHEAWTQRILQTSQPVQHCLTSYDASLPLALQQVYQKQHRVPMVWQLVSSQLDCDRLDYLMRDSYFTGASYGHLDLDRILLALRFDPATGQLFVARKGRAAIEHYLVVRSFMYSQVYNHSKNLAATWLLQQIFWRAQSQLQTGLFADATLTAWLTQTSADLSLQHYLEADDLVFTYHLQRWCNSTDPILADLCQRYRDRNLLKARNLSHLTAEQQAELLALCQTKLQHLGFEPQIYGGLRRSRSRGYSLYQQGILLETEVGWQDIAAISPLVQNLTQEQRQTWLIYPREVEAPLMQRFQALSAPNHSRA